MRTEKNLALRTQRPHLPECSLKIKLDDATGDRPQQTAKLFANDPLVIVRNYTYHGHKVIF